MEKKDSVMKGLMGAVFRQNFWARTTSTDFNKNVDAFLYRGCVCDGQKCSCHSHWWRDNSQFSSTTTNECFTALLTCEQVLHNGSLYINDTQQDDTGLYTCTLDDGVEQKTMSAALTVVTGNIYYFCC